MYVTIKNHVLDPCPENTENMRFHALFAHEFEGKLDKASLLIDLFMPLMVKEGYW